MGYKALLFLTLVPITEPDPVPSLAGTNPSPALAPPWKGVRGCPGLVSAALLLAGAVG